MKYLREFGEVSEGEEHSADLFFEELTQGHTRARSEATQDRRTSGSEAYQEQPATGTTIAAATPQPYLPTGGRTFVAQTGTFNCSPTPFTVIPASFLPARTTDPAAAIDTALTTAGLSASQRRRISRAGLTPIATELGPNALSELMTRLRWSAADITHWGRRSDRMLVQRLLIHIPGHFRELARRAPNESEAFVLESLGWLLMSTLRNSVAGATRQRWWIPPAPSWASAVPNPIPALSSEIVQLITRHGLIDTAMTPGQWNGRFNAWATGLPGRQWHSELHATRPGLPLYSSLLTIPAHVDTSAARARFATSWTQRLADNDARHTPHAAGAPMVTLAGLQNAAALRRCENSNPHLPAGAIASLGLQGLSLAYNFPMAQGRRAITRLSLMSQLHPVFTALFVAIGELGWNDLMYQTSGAGCFRGIKHPASARVNVNGTPTRVSPFSRPNATTVTRINTNFSPAQRARVVRASRTARQMSEHGLGAAIDIDVPENAQGVAARPYGSMDPRIVAIFEAFHFRWGGCFNTTDPHHFEYCQAACAPAAVPASPGIGTPSGMIPSGAGPALA